MNQDFTVKKKQYLSKKKIRAGGFTWKKNSCTSSARKKKFVPAENSPHPHYFSNGPSLNPLKCNEVLNIITFCNKFNKVFRVTFGIKFTDVMQTS